MTGEEKKTITREKHPGRVAQDDKLAALMKKRKEKILRNKGQSKEQSTEQSTEQSKEQPTEQSSLQSSVQSTEQSSVWSTVQSNDTYIYGAGVLAVLIISVCAFLHITLFNLKIKNSMIKNRINHKKDDICFSKKYTINE